MLGILADCDLDLKDLSLLGTVGSGYSKSLPHFKGIQYLESALSRESTSAGEVLIVMSSLSRLTRFKLSAPCVSPLEQNLFQNLT
jgi:hypothetical protein